MRFNQSSEDYLETILVLSNRLPAVRSVDIAAELNFSKPSVSHAMKLLRNAGHITVSPQGFISLTDSGREIAESVYERHLFFTEALIRLGVPEDIASEDACNIEHVISKESFEALKAHAESFNK